MRRGIFQARSPRRALSAHLHLTSSPITPVRCLSAKAKPRGGSRSVTKAATRKTPFPPVSAPKNVSPPENVEVVEPPEIDISAHPAPQFAASGTASESSKENSDANRVDRFPHFHAHERAITTKLQEMIAVDLAGETAAVRICQAHLFFYPGDAVVEEILHEERTHFDIMMEWAGKLDVSKSALDPVFHATSLAMGTVTALLGRKAIMCCHAAIEEVITEHYNDQLREVIALEDSISAPSNESYGVWPPVSERKPQLIELRQTIKQLRDEEQHHHELGIDHGGRDFFGSSILYNAVKCACKVGIFLAKRF